MWRWLAKQADRLQTSITIWGLIAGSAMTSTVFVWVARATAWLDAWGPIAWLAAGAIGVLAFLCFAIVCVALSQAIFLARYQRRLYKRPDAIDTMQTQYHGKRIVLETLFPPFPGYLEGRTFENCDIIGPLNIIPLGTSIAKSNYVSTDYILVTPEALNAGRIYNARIIKDSRFIDCRFYNISILISDLAYNVYNNSGGCNWITHPPAQGALAGLGTPAAAGPSPLAAQSGTQPQASTGRRKRR
jgi:membrane protein implicated in regulation of membrane protease activity